MKSAPGIQIFPFPWLLSVHSQRMRVSNQNGTFRIFQILANQVIFMHCQSLAAAGHRWPPPPGVISFLSCDFPTATPM
jgi:hypothetical protein